MPLHHRRTTLLATALTCAWLTAAGPAHANTDPHSKLPAAIGKSPTGAPQPTIVRETIVAHDRGDNSLPIALAAGAMLVAIGGAGGAVVLATRSNRPTTHRSA